MEMRTTSGGMARRIAIVSIAAAAVLVMVATAALAFDFGRSAGNFNVEVSEDHTRFVFAGNHVLDEETYGEELAGLPAYGDSFVTQGYIYEEGTLQGDVGVNEDGTARWPEKVIGEWTCYGVHLGEGAATATGPWVVTTQVFNFYDTYGDQTIVTDGYEIADFGEPVSRAVTGGTGKWKRARGEQTQVTLGFTDYFGLQFENSFRVRR